MSPRCQNSAVLKNDHSESGSPSAVLDPLTLGRGANPLQDGCARPVLNVVHPDDQGQVALVAKALRDARVEERGLAESRPSIDHHHAIGQDLVGELRDLAFAAEEDLARKGVVGEWLGARVAGSGDAHGLASDCGAGSRGAWSTPLSTGPGRRTQDAAAFPDIRSVRRRGPRRRCRRSATE